MTRVLHIHVPIPDNFEGELHVHVGKEAGPSPQVGAVEHSRSVASIISRFEAHDPTTQAREVLEELVSRGWQAFAPSSRKGEGRSPAAYIRLVYKGAARDTSIFLNTVALICARKDATSLASVIDAAELHGDDMYIYHSDGRVDEALEGMSVLMRWADGGLDD